MRLRSGAARIPSTPLPEGGSWAVAVVLPAVSWESEECAAAVQGVPFEVEAAVAKLKRHFPGAELVVERPVIVSLAREANTAGCCRVSISRSSR